VTLKLKSHEHELSTRQTTLDQAVSEKAELMALAERLLRRPTPPDDPVRLLGLSVSSLTDPAADTGQQLELAFP
jgi:DNA polymerase-4